MTDSENWKERRNQVARYRAMEQETTDPLAGTFAPRYRSGFRSGVGGIKQRFTVLKAGGNMSNLLFTLGVGAGFFLAVYQWITMLAEAH